MSDNLRVFLLSKLCLILVGKTDSLSGSRNIPVPGVFFPGLIVAVCAVSIAAVRLIYGDQYVTRFDASIF